MSKSDGTRSHVEIWHAGAVVATHERLQGRFGERLVLDHYLELLQRKPGAFPRSRALQQARAVGAWPAVYDQLFSEFKHRFGEAEGTRQLLAVLLLHRDCPAAAVEAAVTQALGLGCCEAGAIVVLLRAEMRPTEQVPVLTDLGKLARYGQTSPIELQAYDALRPSRRQEVTYE